MAKTTKKLVANIDELSSKLSLCTTCIICGDAVSLTEAEEEVLRYGKPVIKVCEKCKKAIMKMREQMDE